MAWHGKQASKQATALSKNKIIILVRESSLSAASISPTHHRLCHILDFHWNLQYSISNSRPKWRIASRLFARRRKGGMLATSGLSVCSFLFGQSINALDFVDNVAMGTPTHRSEKDLLLLVLPLCIQIRSDQTLAGEKQRVREEKGKGVGLFPWQ